MNKTTRRNYATREAALAARTERRGDCLIWTGAKTDKGYASWKFDGKVSRVHRWVYEQHHGPIPAGMLVDHTCHNRDCLEPAHLRLATNKQNMENRSRANGNSRSGIRGAIWKSREQKWLATVTHHGTRHYLGYYDTPEEAGRVAAAKRAELFTHAPENRNPLRSSDPLPASLEKAA